MEYASKAAQAGFDPAPSVLRARMTTTAYPLKTLAGRLHSVCFVVCHTIFFAFLVVPIAGRAPLRRDTERMLTLFTLLFALLRGWENLCGPSKVLHFFCLI